MPIQLHSSPMKYKDQNGNYQNIVGVSGEPGRGITSAVLNDDYTLTINFTDGTSTTTLPIRGEKGDDYVLTSADIEEIADAVPVHDWAKAEQKPSYTAAEVGAVEDVQINGTSILNNGIANIPYASTSAGAVKVNGAGLEVVNGLLRVLKATSAQIKGQVANFSAIVPSIQHEAVFYGLAKAAGDSTQSASTNAVGTYTENALSAIAQMLNAPVNVSGTTPTINAQAGVRYICGEVSTLNITLPASGCVDVTFKSGSSVTVLTITPPSGITLKWANEFDPTALEANTTYEINIQDGLGVAVAWT